jgi:uncharacterized protein YndB with AHSA1/START domain
MDGYRGELDARPGGVFQVDPNGRNVIPGKFVEVDPPRRVVFTWASFARTPTGRCSTPIPASRAAST